MKGTQQTPPSGPQTQPLQKCTPVTEARRSRARLDRRLLPKQPNGTPWSRASNSAPPNGSRCQALAERVALEMDLGAGLQWRRAA